MTACNLFLGRTAAFLLTDQVATQDDGMVVALLDKLVVSDRLKIAAVISGRNSIRFDGYTIEDPAFDLVSELLERAASPAEVKAGLPRALRGAQKQIDSWQHGAPSSLHGYFAVWSEGRPDAWVIGSLGHEFPQLAPYNVAPVDGVAQPPVDRALWPDQGHDLTPQLARALIEEQRRTPSAWGTLTVGGAAELVTVDATGIRREIVRRWRQDRPGRKIDPRPWWRRLRVSWR